EGTARSATNSGSTPPLRLWKHARSDYAAAHFATRFGSCERETEPDGGCVFCPNCGTQNSETASTCTKCGFNLKGAAAPKFKGTMLMSQQPAMPSPAAAPRPAPPAPPAPPGPP